MPWLDRKPEPQAVELTDLRAQRLQRELDKATQAFNRCQADLEQLTSRYRALSLFIEKFGESPETLRRSKELETQIISFTQKLEATGLEAAIKEKTAELQTV